MKRYNRVMAGAKSVYAQHCFTGGFIGLDNSIPQDLTGRLPEDWRSFNKEFIPIFLASFPGKTRIAAGLSCGFLWTVAKGLKLGDIVITPDGSGRYRAGEISSDYYYAPGELLPHRRRVNWFSEPFDRSDMSQELQRSTSSTGSCCDVSKYAEELNRLIGGQIHKASSPESVNIEDPVSFALEKHLEDFLVSNWSTTDLGKRYDIYSVDGESVGQQYPSDTGPMDILAISKDGQELLVVELKKGRASDSVVGQIQRYMGYVIEELAEPHQTVKGVIIAMDDDLRIRRALRVAQGIEFFRYKISFSLVPALL